MSTDEPDAEDLAERFPHVAQLEQELREADIDVGDIPQRKGTTRRDLLAGSAGLLGLGGILTGATGSAQAGDDQVGDFGTEAAPLDGYVEDLYDKNGNRVAELPGDGSLDVLQDLSAESVNAGELTGTYPGNVRAISAGGVVASIDPATSSNPIQDAVDAIDAADGYGRIQYSGSIQCDSKVLTDEGIVFEGLGRATIQFTATGTGTHGFHISHGAFPRQHGGIYNTVVQGPGKANTTGSGLYLDGDVRAFNIDQTEFVGWNGDVVFTDTGKPFNLNWGNWAIRDCAGVGLQTDGSTSGMGPAAHLGTVIIGGGEITAAINHSGGGKISFDTINIGGISGSAQNAAIELGGFGNSSFTTGAINFEPAAEWPGGGRIVRSIGGGTVDIGPIFNTGPDIKEAVLLTVTPGGQNTIKGVRINGGTVANNLVNVTSDLGAPCAYWGSTADVSNNSGGALSNPVHCYDGDVT